MGDLAIVLVIVLVLVLLWRGPRTLPRLGEALGRGVRDARDAARTRSDADPGSTSETRPAAVDRTGRDHGALDDVTREDDRRA